MLRESPATALLAPPYLSLAGIRKSFGAFTALSGIDLAIHQGEFVCLLGPSGCGKTTLLRIIAGLEHADHGDLELRGRDISRLPPAARDYGIVFQSYALFPNLSVAANIAYGLTGRREDKQRRVNELLELIGLPGSGEKFPAQLSGGQQQRVALARALATSPGLLLLDEPLSALDAQVREHLRSEIKALQRRLGVTTIMVTHDQEEALAMADRVVVMNHGVIEQIGPPDVIYREPATPFVAGFVGQGNWLDGVVTQSGQLSTGESVIHSLALRDTAIGTRMRLFIRPEDVRVSAHWTGAINCAPGELTGIELLGSQYRLNLFVPQWNRMIHADVSHAQLADLHYQRGQRLPVQLPPELLRAFDGSVIA
ncbi:putative 2-aminoethylphosphonate ABC transporter ATP-binding protein [Chitinibacteraceae bacterium HSL-7]